MQQRKVMVIAEAGVNHNGCRDQAFELIDAAAQAGADAVKFQTFRASRLVSRRAPKASYQKNATVPSESQLDMLRKLELPLDWHTDLQRYARDRDIEFLSTAFDADSLDFLCRMDLPLYKVPSGEINNSPLLWQFARCGRPLVLSTGMATLGEVEQALAVVSHALSREVEPSSMEEVWRAWSLPDVRLALAGKVTLLHCTSRYPTPPDEANLAAMNTLTRAFGLPVGYSDHTAGIAIPIAAVALGAVIIEKHFTLDRTMKGPDHAASLEPEEMKAMIEQIRIVSGALGDAMKAPQVSEWDTRQAARQQIVAARAIAKGAVLARTDLTTARCGAGMPAAMLWDQVGRVAARSYEEGEVFQG